MARKIKFSYENIDEAELSNRLDKRGLYYANVVMWTMLFTLPVLILLDFLFLKSEWNQLFLARVIFGLASYVVFILGTKKKWNYISSFCYMRISSFYRFTTFLFNIIDSCLINKYNYFLETGKFINS